MEDEQNKIGTFLKCAKIIVIVIVTIVVLFFVYNIIVKKINTSNYKNYLLNHNFTSEKDKTLIKEIKDTDNDYNLTRYKAFFEDSIMSKEISIQENNNFINMILWYKTNDEIVIELQLDGPNKYDEYGILYQKGEYKKDKFSCEVVSGKGYNTKCQLMKNEVNNFNQEMKDILKDSKSKAKYINK